MFFLLSVSYIVSIQVIPSVVFSNLLIFIFVACCELKLGIFVHYTVVVHLGRSCQPYAVSSWMSVLPKMCLK